jgi:hypothetical protein
MSSLIDNASLEYTGAAHAPSKRGSRIVEIQEFSRGTNRTALEQEITSAERMILSLADDWDGEGSPGYSRETMRRAAVFVRTQFDRLLDIFGMDAPVPYINPGPNGTIDIHWKQPTWQLLVNIPANEGEPASFYGDDTDGDSIKGTVNINSHKFGLLAWLMK